MSELLQTIEIETRPNPTHSIIWMHGLGADGNDFVPIVPEIKLDLLAVRYVFPNAPMQPVTINGGYVMRAWYDIAGQDLDRRADEKGIRQSQQAIEALIEREIERGIAAQRIVLAGFSQGGVIALQTGLRHAKRLAGIMSLSAYLPLSETLDKEAHPSNQSLPVFIAHGIADNVVPMQLGTTSRDRLTALGYAVEWHQYPMPHSVCPEEISDLAAWLRRVLI
jgi:phospholipase/carboxylesterase